MICIECGKEAELYNNLCADCFRAKKQFIDVPKIVDIRLCIHCGARERGKQWLDVESVESAIEASILDALKLDDEVENRNRSRYQGQT